MIKFSSIINSIQYGIKNKQIVSLLTWNVLNIPLSFIINILITNILGSALYGDYMYINSLFNVGIIIITLGFFQATNRAIVISNSEVQIREFYGALLVILVLLYILLTIVLFLYYIFDSNLNAKNLNTIFFYFLPFGFVFLLSQYFETLLMADNRIDKLVLTR
jgi:O-antigen/teichoic acid export membrane protein